MKAREVKSNRDLLSGYRIVQPPMVALNALRKSSCTRSFKRSIHEQISPNMQNKHEWNVGNGNSLVMQTIAKSKRVFQRS